ncbi:lipoprotein insertase outer membrane protein LolB [Reinekea sp.]|jgi:outer membrane lipoprotein LolB|uniref:lipoprotein insertase outer membrane protein LolB n=1 Tax=Reinekea sp. TaxID=1970455 RepID=UPI003989F669
MISRFKWFLATCVTLIATSCATFTGLPENEAADWAFQGKMAIKNNSEASSFNVIWQQLGKEFDIELSGPLGQGRITIHGDKHSVTLTQGKDQWTANSLEDLLWDLQEIQLPLDYLQYWVRALPKPSEPFNRELNSDSGQVTQLKQAGWLVHYDSYHEGTPSMPKKLNFIKADSSGKLVIREWSLLQLPPS